jgi:quercetin dioxygenase-like cupin family protein
MIDCLRYGRDNPTVERHPMALKHALSGEVLQLLPATPATALISQALVCAPRLEVMRLALEAGKLIPGHAVAGPLTIQCLQGSVEVQADGVWQSLEENQLIYVAEGVEHALQAKAGAIVLVTLVRLPHTD